MVDCNVDKLKQDCICTYSTCSRRGKCCECVSYHLENNELPGCVFAKLSKEAEKSYNRDFEYFAKLLSEK